MTVDIILTTIGTLILVKAIWVLTNPHTVSRLMHVYANHPKKVRNISLVMALIGLLLIFFAQLFN